MQATNTAGYDAPIGLTADPVVFTLLDGRLSVLLARRLEEPQRGMFALPGGFVGASESPEQTAERKLREKTGGGSARPARLPAVDRLHGARAARDAAGGASRGPRRLLASARRAARARARSCPD